MQPNLKSVENKPAPVINQDDADDMASAIQEYVELKACKESNKWKFHVTQKIDDRLDAIRFFIAETLAESTKV